PARHRLGPDQSCATVERKPPAVHLLPQPQVRERPVVPRQTDIVTSRGLAYRGPPGRAIRQVAHALDGRVRDPIEAFHTTYALGDLRPLADHAGREVCVAIIE